MSISARATHVMSAMLIAVFAWSAPAWPQARQTRHCPAATAECCQSAVTSCCGPTATVPAMSVARQDGAPPPSYVSTAALMDRFLPRPVSPRTTVRSSQWLRALDLPTLHRALVI